MDAQAGAATKVKSLSDRNAGYSEVNILDALTDTESWLNRTRCFGPLSGYETKLDKPAARYVATVFSYGCNLGPHQTFVSPGAK